MKQAEIITAWKPVVAIVGPTAIGKSRIGIEVAKTLNTEILTADSRQVYRYMNIGTDKPSLAEQQGIPHRLIDLVNPDQSFNAGNFRQHATQDIARLHRQGRLPLVIGGTGLYIRALLRGLCPGPPANWHIRNELAQEAKIQGPAFLYEKLQQVDPDLAQRLHPNDQPKIQRALEVYRILGTPLSVMQQQHQFDDIPYPSLLIGLTMERQALYQRIETRVDWEIQKGLVEETQFLMDQGFSRELGSMKGLGYRQFSGYLAGDYSYEEAVRLLKRDTRHFAKRQMTWFQKESGIEWVTLEESDIPYRAATTIVDHITQFLCTFENSPSPAETTSHSEPTHFSG
ncbi:MAG TPA: tRNA (adenosine(37)-N6)-dimethylallyltransferase MiaA [Nitrospiraceae bacterium]|nr:tRNA (adenosine(37)-N6)-dimethylallyltransferase MiaA [Nitrospiraceae bacterium]